MVCSASDPAVSLKAIARVAEYTYKHGLIKLRCLGKSVAIVSRSQTLTRKAGESLVTLAY